MHCTLLNKNKNKTKDCKVGFSWTFLFFGGWVTLFRKDWLFLFISIIIYSISSSIHYFISHNIQLDIDVMGTYHIIMAFIYNRIYINRMIQKDFLPASKQDMNLLKQRNYLSRKNLSTIL